MRLLRTVLAVGEPATERGSATIDGPHRALLLESPVGESIDPAVVYDNHADDVVRWIRRLLGPAGMADVEDVAHDVFVAAFRRLPTFRADATVSTWLFGFCAHFARRWRRRQAIRRVFQLSQSKPPVADSRPVIENLERRDAGRRLYAAIDQLPEAYRTPLILFELEGLSGQQVAELLGLPLKTVWVRLHRARARLEVAVRNPTAAASSAMRSKT